MELLNPTLDNNLASSWKSWPDHGTPGAINHGIVATSFLSENDFNYTISPNPFSDQATLSISKGKELLFGRIEIIDLLGRLIETKPVPDAHHIQLDRFALSTGTYFFIFYDHKNRIFTGHYVIME